MKRPRLVQLEPIARPLSHRDLERVTGGTDIEPSESVAGIFKLKQHVDNPGQTP